MSWCVTLFGVLDVSGGELTSCSFETKKSALLLARLALSDRSIPRDELADFLWPEDFLDATRGRLRQELSRLRKALGPAAEIVIADREFIRLDRTHTTVDVLQFEAALRSAQNASDGITQRAHLERAIHLASGEFLPGFSDDWVVSERQRLVTEHVEALLKLAELERSGERLKEVLCHARAAVHLDPLHEGANVSVLRLLADSQQDTEAIRHYQSFERILKTELGAVPSERVRTLIDELRQSPQTRGFLSERAQQSTVSELHMPTPLTPLYGRESDVARLQAYFMPGQPASVRLVTLTGPGGIGKTRLAVEAGTVLTQDYGGRCWFVPVADLSDPDAIPQRALQSLGVEHTGPEDPYLLLNRFLDSQPALIVLDNLEQFVDGAAGVVRKLLEQNRRLHVLATSRQCLGIGGEQEFPVGPLVTPELPGPKDDLPTFPGIKMFVEGARRVRPDFEPSPQTLATIATLVRRLDGIPLAIHLASARCHVLTPQQMLEQLESRFEFLVSRRTDLDERHRTLRSTIAWSFMLLSEDLQRFFFFLSVFRGGWTYESARVVTGEPKTLTFLEQLRERSLITEHESGSAMRFRMLETLREYALEQADPGLINSARVAHCLHFADLAAQAERNLLTVDQRRWYQMLDDEIDNIREALRWAVRHDRPSAVRFCANMWRYWSVRGLQNEARSLQSATLDHGDDYELTSELGFAWFGAAVTARDQSDSPEAFRCFDRALEVYEVAGSALGVALVQLNVAAMHMDVTDYAKAKKLQSESLAAYQRLNHKPMVALCMSNLAISNLGLGDVAHACRLLEEALLIRQGMGEPWAIADSEVSLSVAYFERGDTERAIDLLRRGRDRFVEIQDHSGMARAYRHLAEYCMAAGNLDEAIDALKSCRAVYERICDPAGIAWVDHQQGVILLRTGEQTGAAALMERSLRSRVRLHNSSETLASLRGYVELLVTLGDIDGAALLYQHCENLTKELEIVLLPSAVRAQSKVVAELLSDALPAGQTSMGEAVRYALDRTESVIGGSV